MIRVLVYSRDSRLLSVFSTALQPDFDVRVESDSERVRTLASSQKADVLILDFDSEYSDLRRSLSLFEQLESCDLPVIVMTDDKARQTALELIHRSAFDWFLKPPSVVELNIVLRRAYEHCCLKRELNRIRGTASPETKCDGLVGEGPLSQGVYDLIRRVSNLDAYVLVTGESGTGKELVARAIHNLSRRSDAPFVAVSCGAIPETLLEAELFGHEKGAYTGTVGSREGYFEQAGRGTLFLDEIGELSLNAQVKLLRVLQQREFSRLGSNKLIPLKARVLFATHRNLLQLVDEGKFRSDLYFRVNVMEIKVPALRDRPEEIPALANHFLEKYSNEYGKPVGEIHSSAITRMMNYNWPGNIRELENAIARAVIVCEGDCILPRDLPDSLWPEDDNVICVPPPDNGSNSFEEQMRDYKLRLATRAIQECNGNKTLAAKKMKISRAYLHRLLRGDDGQALIEVA